LAKIERRIEILVNEPDKNDAAPSLELFPGLEAEDSSPSQQP
jgi:hypothetical protein